MNRPIGTCHRRTARSVGLALNLAMLAAIALLAAGCREKSPPASAACHSAIYRLDDGRLLDIGPTDGDDLRWLLSDGRRGGLAAAAHGASTLGWTGRPDGVTVDVPACGSDGIVFKDKDAEAVKGSRVPLVATDATFTSHGTELFGRLTLPVGDAAVPIVIEVHGSEKFPATDFYFEQRLYPAWGVGAFVYDKRGTGRSKGHYTQDFDLLADDAAAAVAKARELAGTRAARVGFEGLSQGGWIAPLAATRTHVDFVVVGFGLAGSPAEENIDETVVELARKGYGAQDLAAAAEVAEATNEVLGSRFRQGYRALDAARGRYRGRPWFKQLHGQFTGELLEHSDWVLRLVGPFFDVGTPVRYDAMAVLNRLETPMLWVLAGDDTLAPNATTRARLKTLADAGHPITELVFPNTDHGIREFITTDDGERLDTRTPDGYLRTTVDFALNGRLDRAYGTAETILSQ
jgi:dienelactone hydrolase